jgi:hypothetical protein
MPSRQGPPSPPEAAQLARAFTAIQAGLPLIASFAFLFPAKNVGWAENLVPGLGALAALALVLSSAVGMGRRRRWAWLGALAMNVVTASAWIVLTVWLAHDGGGPEGMVGFVVVLFGLPTIAAAAAAVVMLVLPRVWRYYWRAGEEITANESGRVAQGLERP